MMTDYNQNGFSSRFAAARRFDEERVNAWVDALRWVSADQQLHNIVDLGAGTGRFWPVISLAWDTKRIVAIDKSNTMLEAANREIDLELVTLIADIDDLDALDLGGSAVDAVFCSMALHYSRDPVRLCRIICNRLRPQGLLVVRTGTSETIESFSFLRFFPTAQSAELAAMPESSEVIAWLESAGLTNVRSRTIQSPALGYAQTLGRVAKRGFPSLQLVPPLEFAWGFSRLSIWLALCRLRGLSPRMEQVLLVCGQSN